MDSDKNEIIIIIICVRVSTGGEVARINKFVTNQYEFFEGK